MTEYIIIVALIAVAAIAVYALFGNTIRNQVSGLSQEVAGIDASKEIGNAKTAADAATKAANKSKTLSTYNGNVTDAAAGAGK